MDEAARFAQVRDLFDRVCELGESEREAALAASSAPSEIVARVRALLLREAQAPYGAEAPIAGLLGSLAGVESLPPGTTLGVWTLTRRIGAGGMGTVYQAERSDGHFQQTAAVKLLRGAPSPTALQFLARERQILAGLAHPNIARLFDGGATPSGQPYLVMEYLEGVPLDRYCREQALSVASVLRVLIQICDAVSFAHSRLVVHCDLKPSNILVDANGRPWLLDFGIARLLDGELSEGHPSSVSQRARAFTPGFASPEQEAGGQVTTASDVYSLGRLLEVLAADAASTDAELRAIVAKAVQAEPSARYGSVAAMAQDLQRYLKGEALQAVPATLAYRGRKWLQRRWPLALSGSLFALTVLAFTLQLMADRDRARCAERQANAERDRATQAQAASKQISEFLVSMLDGANPDAGGGEIPTSKLVEQALARIDTELAGQPAVQAELYATLGGVQAVLGNPALAQSSYEKAIALQRTLAQPLVLADYLGRLALLRRRSFTKQDAATVARESLALLQSNAAKPEAVLAATQLLGSIVSEAGSVAEGEVLLRRALSLGEALDPNGVEVSDALDALAGRLTDAAKFEEAEALLQRSLRLRNARTGDEAGVLNTQERLGAVLGRLRRFEEAEVLLRGALEQRRALFGADDVNIPWRLSELARIFDNSGRPLQALPLYREALEIAARKMGTTSIPYAVLLNNLALAQMRVGDYVGSARSYREALALLTDAWGERNSGLAALRINFATLLLKTEPAAALPLLTAGESVYAQTYPPAHPDVIDARLLLAVAALKLKQADRAREWLSKVDTSGVKLAPKAVAEREYALALLDLLTGSLDTAIIGLERAETLRSEALGESDPRVWLAKIERAELLARRASGADKQNARALAAQILSRLDGVLVPDSPVRARLARLR